MSVALLDNAVAGAISTKWKAWTKIQGFNAYDCQLSGFIPSELKASAKLSSTFGSRIVFKLSVLEISTN